MFSNYSHGRIGDSDKPLFSIGGILDSAAAHFATQAVGLVIGQASEWLKRRKLVQAYAVAANETIEYCQREGYPTRSPIWNKVTSLLGTKERARQIAAWYAQGKIETKELHNVSGDDRVVERFVEYFIQRLNLQLEGLLPLSLDILNDIVSNRFSAVHSHIDEVHNYIVNELRTGTAHFTTEWQLTYVEGNSFELIDGIAGTSKTPGGHHGSLFPLDGTVILGDSNKVPPFNTAKHTAASWNIPVEEMAITSSSRCFLLFGCLRHFGGLHSPVANDWVEISLNGQSIDGFEVRIVPDGQTDYFHLRPFPDIPKLHPFSMCENVYSWSIPTSLLNVCRIAQVLVRIATRTKWDIDYVGLMFELPPADRKY